MVPRGRRLSPREQKGAQVTGSLAALAPAPGKLWGPWPLGQLAMSLTYMRGCVMASVWLPFLSTDRKSSYA